MCAAYLTFPCLLAGALHGVTAGDTLTARCGVPLLPLVPGFGLYSFSVCQGSETDDFRGHRRCGRGQGRQVDDDPDGPDGDVASQPASIVSR